VIDDRFLLPAELHVAEDPSQEFQVRGHRVIPDIECKASLETRSPGHQCPAAATILRSGAAHAFPARVMVSGFIVFKTPSILANAGSRSPSLSPAAAFG
jgi:hypothetical protein